MLIKRGIGIVVLIAVLVLAIFVSSEEPDFGSLPPPPDFPGAADGSPEVKFAIPALPGDISGPGGVPDGKCVNLYDIWAMGPQLGVCELPAGSPLDVDGDACFTETDLPTIMQQVNVRCS